MSIRVVFVGDRIGEGRMKSRDSSEESNIVFGKEIRKSLLGKVIFKVEFERL